jgi:hypothetical protein
MTMSTSGSGAPDAEVLFSAYAVCYGLGITTRMGEAVVTRVALTHKAIAKTVSLPAASVRDVRRVELSFMDRMLQLGPEAAFRIATADGGEHFFVLRGHSAEFENACLLMRGLPGNGAPAHQTVDAQVREAIESGRFDAVIDGAMVVAGLLVACGAVVSPWLSVERGESRLLLFQNGVVIVPYLLGGGLLRLLGGPELRKSLGPVWRPTALGSALLAAALAAGGVLYLVLVAWLWRRGYSP